MLAGLAFGSSECMHFFFAPKTTVGAAKKSHNHMFAQNGKRVLDSEWHAIFDCPSHAAARGRFILATKFSRENDAESTVTDLSHIVTYTRSCASRLGELAKFLLNIRLTRRRNHRHLTSNGPNGRVRLLRRLVWDCWRNALTLEH